MTFPTIHMNGTSVEALMEANDQAYQALQLALSALKQAAPNARDYYPQKGNAYTLAIAEHEDRLLRVYAVMTELAEIGEHLATEEEKRRSRR